MLIVFPLDLVRTKLSVDTSHVVGSRLYNGMFDCLQTTVQESGWRGLYKGLLISLVEITPYTAISMGGYEFAKAQLPSNEEFTSSWLCTVAKLGCGWVSGLCGSLVCYPLDTMKRQMMLDGAHGFRARYDNRIIKCFAVLYREGGISAFYPGCLINVLKSAPSLALTFVANDMFRQLLVT